MKIKVILFGSTGMIGKGVLLECIEDSRVESILLINRHPSNFNHKKINEIIHEDFSDFSSLIDVFTDYNTCFFCLGISSVGLSEHDYHRITYELTINVAKTLLKANKDITFFYISGAGTDSSEKGKMMWARVKGKTENALLAMSFKKVYMLRPGYIQPMKGIKSRTSLYNIIYFIFKPLYFILKLFKSIVTDTASLGKAIINVGINGYNKTIIESADINKLAETTTLHFKTRKRNSAVC